MIYGARKLASTIVRNAPIAVRNSKKPINDGLQTDMDQALASSFTTKKRE